MRKVYIVGGGGAGYSLMFHNRGWEEVDTIHDADLVQFTGGDDVTPALYNHYQLPMTRSNLMRDQREVLMYQMARKSDKFIAGICRGGQFLNVMCGGTLWQDVDFHAIRGRHTAHCYVTAKEVEVTSTHHQMMIPNRWVPRRILMSATGRSLHRVRGGPLDEQGQPRGMKEIRSLGQHDDIEAILYIEDKVLCFQPHPEYPNCEDLAEKYFSYVETILMNL